MNSYFKTVRNDIENVQDLSHICRGEWCRSLESEADSLQNELQEFTIAEGDFGSAEIAEMATRLRDAYRHLGPDIRI